MEWKGEWGGEGKRGGLLDDLKATITRDKKGRFKMCV
jgi:hypothetical protein